MSNTKSRKLIAVDCDGTLFGHNALPSQITCSAVQRLVDAGHQIVAATGRSRLTACDRLVSVPGLRYVICSNGAYAWDMHKDALVSENEIWQSKVTEIVSRLRTEYPDMSFGWESRGGINFEDEFIELAGGIDQLESGGQAGDPWSQSLYKLYVRRPTVFRLELLNQVVAVLGGNLCEVAASGVPFIEITALGANKASGLENIAKRLGFTAADTIVFGDNYNDLLMFKWAGHSVAMGNAVEAVQIEADAVTVANTEHGVARYLEDLLDAGEL